MKLKGKLRILACALSLTFASTPPMAAETKGLGNAKGLNTAQAGQSFNRLTEEQKTAHAASKVATLLKALSSAGSNPTALYLPKKSGTSVGYDITIPNSSLGAATFYTRPTPRDEIWHVALSFDATTLRGANSPLAQTYQSITQFLGTPQHESLVFVVSEGDGSVSVNQLPASLSALGEFATGGALNLKKGVNLFTRIKMPDNPTFNTLQQAMLMGGKVQPGSLLVSGSVGYDILGTLLNNTGAPPNKTELAAEDTAKKAAGLPPVSFALALPGAIPVPFSLMDAEEAKRSFYMQIDRTLLGIQYDQTSKQVALSGGQDVTLWIAGRMLKTQRMIGFAQDKSSASNSIYTLTATGSVAPNLPLLPDITLKNVSLGGTMQIDFQKSTWQPGVVDTEAARKSGFQIGGHRGGTTQPAAAPAATPASSTAKPDNKTSELSLALGVTVNVNSVGDLSGHLGLNTVTPPGTSKPRIKEVFFQFNGDPATQGLQLGRIPALAQIPGVREFAVRGLGIGIAPGVQGRASDFYMFGDIEWVQPQVRGQMGLIVKGRDVTFLSRVTDFNLPKVIKTIDPKANETELNRTLGGFRLPDAILVATTAKPTAGSGNQMTVASLPGMIQPMFDGIATSATDVIPIYGDGITVLGKVNLGADPNLRASINALGIQATGDLLLAGSIGGFSSGGANVALYVQLPTFKFPTQDAQMARILSVPQATGNFFVRVNTVGPEVAVGVSTGLRLSVPAVAGTIRTNSEVDINGEIYANVTATGMGIRVAGYTTSPWVRPLGFDGITLNNTAILIGGDSEGAVEIGMGTSLSFDLVTPGSKQGVKLTSLEPRGNQDLRANLKELEKQLANKSSSRKVDVASAFVVNVIVSTGVPVPKKIGLLYNASEVSIPTTLDIFDLVLKGLVQGPAYDELLRKTKEPGLSVLRDIRRGFDSNNWMPPSQKINKAFPVPLDAIYLTNVEFLFATPGAVLPGFPGLDGNVGLKIKGDLWVRDLKTRNTQKVGNAAIDLTLNGIDFGAIGKEIEKSYNQIAAVTIDALVAERNCPAGAFYDVGLASCWSCPPGYDRTWSPVYNNDACKQVKMLTSPAREMGTANQPWSCPSGSVYDPRNQGECWSCPAGYMRTEQPVTDAKACFRVDFSKIANYARIQKHGKATGFIGTDCPSGQFWHIGDGYCYSCPAGTIRHATDINGAQACVGVGNQQVMSFAAAKLDRPGRPAGAFLDIGLGKFYSCPTGYVRTLFDVRANNACERVEVNLAAGKSEPRGQFRNMATDRCFGSATGNLANGANVVVQNCLDRDSRFQSWFLDSLKRLRPIQQLEVTQGALCLDVEGGRAVNNANIRIANCNPSAEYFAQQWSVSEDGQVRSRLDSSLCLGFSGNNIALQTCVGTAPAKLAQSWKFGPSLVKPAAEPGTTLGPVLLKLQSNPDQCIESGTPAPGLKACNGLTPQVWYLDSKGLIRNANGSQCLDATAASKNSDGVATTLAACNVAAPNQLWMRNPAGQFVNGLGRCLGTTSRNTLETRACQPANAETQGWTYVRTPNTAPDLATAERNLEAQRQAWFRENGHIRPGAFRIASTINDTLCLAAAPPLTNGRGIVLDNCTSTATALQFNISPDGKSLELGDGYCLDVSGPPRTDGAKLQAWVCNGTGPQNFEYHAASGAIRIPQFANKCVDATGGHLVKGTAMQLWGCNASNAQKWKVK